MPTLPHGVMQRVHRSALQQRHRPAAQRDFDIRQTAQARQGCEVPILICASAILPQPRRPHHSPIALPRGLFDNAATIWGRVNVTPSDLIDPGGGHTVWVKNEINKFESQHIQQPGRRLTMGFMQRWTLLFE